ncbi:MAG: hypothetical protein M0T74_07395 [Desulfitobacterium hafniense]|nr:hypothetical protein [Desulfitobacterium hafniense]
MLIRQITQTDLPKGLELLQGMDEEDRNWVIKQYRISITVEGNEND